MSKENKETEKDTLRESFQNNKELEDELFNILDDVIIHKKFLSFESGRRDDKDFGFEWVWTDVIPTLSPNWDCIVPVNFWYDWQRRTILLIIEVMPDGEETIYRLPEWDNHYTMKKENFYIILIS